MSVIGGDKVTADGRLEQHSAPPSENASAQLSAVVDELINSLSTKFDSVSSEMFAKMDEMSKRLDSLEASIQQQTESSANK